MVYPLLLVCSLALLTAGFDRIYSDVFGLPHTMRLEELPNVSAGQGWTDSSVSVGRRRQTASMAATCGMHAA